MDPVIRKMDQLGRVLIPKHIRAAYEIEEEDSDVEIIPTSEGILIRKLLPSCFICKSVNDLIELDGRNVCMSCLAKLNDLANQKADE